MDFFVDDTPGPVIFGLQTCKDLSLVTINCAIETQTGITVVQPITTRDELQLYYPERFKGIGLFPGTQKLVLKEGYESVVYAPHRAPFQLKEKNC